MVTPVAMNVILNEPEVNGWRKSVEQLHISGLFWDSQESKNQELSWVNLKDMKSLTSLTAGQLDKHFWTSLPRLSKLKRLILDLNLWSLWSVQKVGKAACKSQIKELQIFCHSQCFGTSLICPPKCMPAFFSQFSQVRKKYHVHITSNGRSLFQVTKLELEVPRKTRFLHILQLCQIISEEMPLLETLCIKTYNTNRKSPEPYTTSFMGWLNLFPNLKKGMFMYLSYPDEWTPSGREAVEDFLSKIFQETPVYLGSKLHLCTSTHVWETIRTRTGSVTEVDIVQSLEGCCPNWTGTANAYSQLVKMTKKDRENYEKTVAYIALISLLLTLPLIVALIFRIYFLE